ncbi:MAG: glycosyltransferase [Chloroflexi bacterium]|nr:glycosyltransferase [Chloroflexota bacterium]
MSTLTFDEAGGAHNPTQIARALAQRGHRVLFVEPQPSAMRNTERLPLEIVALTELGMTPVQLRRAWFGMETGELETVARALWKHISSFPNGRCAAIFSAPFDPFVRLVPMLRAQNFLIAYYAMDDFAAAPALGHTQFAPGAEEYLVRHADVLCGVSAHIANTLERFGKHAHVVPNGVDIETFQSNKSVSRAQIERGELTLGFWGTLIDSMFDAELIAYVAQARPRWTIHLLGAPDPEPHRPSVVARLKQFTNILFHGAVPHSELPRYAAAFDVCLAPFPDNAFTRGRDPIKVYEYLAAHVPVAASYAPQLAALPYVFVAQAPDEYIGAIEQAARTRVDTRALDEFLAQQTWDARAAQLLDALRGISTQTQTGEPSILPSFAQPDAQAVMRYATALEQELEQVQAWARELEKIAQAGGALERVKRLLPNFGRRA